MEKYKTMLDFGGVGVMPVLSSIVTAIPPFFSIIYFLLWIFGTGGSYYVMLKTTNKKRFWHALTAMSFVCFLLSLLTASMNTVTLTFLDGYWVGFYILMILASYYMLANYK